MQRPSKSVVAGGVVALLCLLWVAHLQWRHSVVGTFCVSYEAGDSVDGARELAREAGLRTWNIDAAYGRNNKLYPAILFAESSGFVCALELDRGAVTKTRRGTVLRMEKAYAGRIAYVREHEGSLAWPEL